MTPLSWGADRSWRNANMQSDTAPPVRRPARSRVRRALKTLRDGNARETGSGSNGVPGATPAPWLAASR